LTLLKKKGFPSKETRPGGVLKRKGKTGGKWCKGGKRGVRTGKRLETEVFSRINTTLTKKKKKGRGGGGGKETAKPQKKKESTRKRKQKKSQFSPVKSGVYQKKKPEGVDRKKQKTEKEKGTKARNPQKKREKKKKMTVKADGRVRDGQGGYRKEIRGQAKEKRHEK